MTGKLILTRPASKTVRPSCRNSVLPHNQDLCTNTPKEALLTPQGSTRSRFTLSDPIFRRTILTSLVVSVVYYVTAKIGFRFALQPGSVSTLWMPNSVLLAGLLLTPSRWWWLVISVTLPAHLASELQSGVPTVMVLSWFLSNSTQALLGAALMKYFAAADIRLSRSRDLTIFLICGALVAPLIASFLDSSLIKLNGWGHDPYWEIWRLRFLSNVLATLIIIPFVIDWVQHGISSFKQASRFKYLEATVLFTTLFIVSFFIFTSRNSLLQTPALLYFPLPFLVWATIRFGLRGVSSGLLVVMVFAIVGAADGSGPFIGNDSAYRALSIQAFLIVISVPLFLLVAVIEERQIAEAAARINEERLILALNAAQMDTWDWQISKNHVMRSPTGSEAADFSYDSEATIESFYSFLHPDDRPIVQSAIAEALEKRTPYQVEFRVILNDRVFWYQSKGKVSYDDTNTDSHAWCGNGHN